MDPQPSCPLRCCALATRASRSVAEIGTTSPVIGLSSGAAKAARGKARAAPAARAPRPKRRRSSSGKSIRSPLAQRLAISGAGVDAVEPGDEVRPASVEAGAVARGLEREAHHDVGGGEIVAGEPVALAELGLEPIEMRVEHALQRRSRRAAE